MQSPQMQFQLPGRVAPAASALLKIISENFNHPSLGSATVDLLRAVEQENQEKLNYYATFSTALASMQETLSRGIAQRKSQLQLNAMRPQPEQKQTPDPDPLLDDVLNGLAAVLQRIDQLQRTMDKKDSGDTVITYGSDGLPAKIRRSDGTELTIGRDYNRRQLTLRRSR